MHYAYESPHKDKSAKEHVCVCMCVLHSQIDLSEGAAPKLPAAPLPINPANLAPAVIWY